MAKNLIDNDDYEEFSIYLKCDNDVLANRHTKGITFEDYLFNYVISQKKHLKWIKLFIENGFDVNHSMYDDSKYGQPGHTPFMSAVLANRVDICEVMIENGANIRASSDRYYDGAGCPMLDAISNGSIEIVKLLMKHGYGVDERESNGDLPLFIALEHENDDITTLFLLNGANFNLVFDEFERFNHLGQFDEMKKKLTKFICELDLNPSRNIKGETSEHCTY